MNPQAPIRWRLGVLAGIAVVLVTAIPQIRLWIDRGRDWHGSYAFTDPDELAYSAYLHSIIEGRSKLNNPYLSERVATTNNAQNLFSVQFVPVYAIALPARLLRLSASTVFILLVPLMAFLSTIATFWLLAEVTGDDRVAAIGVLMILLCGLLVSEYPFLRTQNYGTFAFLRRYIPAVPFPCFFLFCGFIWRAFTGKNKRFLLWSFAAAITFILLLYSYFYLWTAAAAWLFCFAVAWMAARPRDLRQILKILAIVSFVALSGLIPYFYLLSHRTEMMDQVQVLSLTHAPDFLRFTEIISVFILMALALNVRNGIIKLSSPSVLFAASCAMSTFVVFNQQIITGLSLQSFHYEQFIINYVLLASVVISYHLLWRRLRVRPAMWVAFALIVGLVTGLKSASETSDINQIRDKAMPLFAAIAERAKSEPPNSAVLFDRPSLAASMPTEYLIDVLWSPYIYTFGTSSHAENVERFYQYLYYKGTNANMFETLLKDEPMFRGAIFGVHRVNPKLTQDFQPVSENELREQKAAYSDYINRFSLSEAARWPLSYIVLSESGFHDLSNVDRWYERDFGEHRDGSVLYQVRLRNGRK